MYFPFLEYWPFFAGFVLFVLVLLSIDLGVFHRRSKAHEINVKEAAAWTAISVVLALLFNLGLWQFARSRLEPAVANRLALEFLTGYLVEQALSVDNLFVFVIIFSYFGIQNQNRHRILFYGILGAIAFRGIFIALGSVLLRFQWVLIGFGILLIITGIRMFAGGEEHDDPENSFAVRVVRRVLPNASRFLLCLAVIEISDVIFAIDSVPAIFAITREPLIVFTSNIFAILALRSMFFLLSSVIGRFHLLKYGLGTVLVFIGLKMAWLNDLFHGHFPIGISLAIIALSIGMSIIFSLLIPPKSKSS